MKRARREVAQGRVQNTRWIGEGESTVLREETVESCWVQEVLQQEKQAGGGVQHKRMDGPGKSCRWRARNDWLEASAPVVMQVDGVSREGENGDWGCRWLLGNAVSYGKVGSAAE
jgi:hypothetical protein